jgi:hypothetical protein
LLPEKEPNGPTCSLDGATYQRGEQFKSDCNTCSCDDSGEIICTAQACDTRCEWDGGYLLDGEKVELGGGCGYCICLAGAVACTDTACPPVQCEMDGTYYAPGDQVGKDCNACTCQDNGQFVCTAMACLPTCEWEGKTLKDGEKVLFEDGCGYCVCLGGAVACTATVCLPGQCELDGVYYEVGAQVAQDCNTCTCLENGVFACTDMGCPSTCEWDGQILHEGQKVLQDDGCNYCVCLNGKVACETGNCLPGTCFSDGKSFKVGENHTLKDGCTVCTCTESGVFSCPVDACECNPEEEYYRHYVAGAEECSMMDQPLCPDGATYFSNDCGCGCEMSSSCPDVVNCMPPADTDWCNDGALEACPYTSIEE